MLFGILNRPSDKQIFIILFGFAILSLVIISFNSFIYFGVIVVNIIVFSLLSLFYKEFVFYSINWIVILLLFLHTWEKIDINLNKFKYYISFEPLTKYECLAAYNLDKNSISQNVHCKYGLSLSEKKEINTYLKKNKDLIEHLKNLDCYSIEFSEKYIQFWFDDIVIDLNKIDDHTIVYETSDLN
jgi:hypothetical protein